MSDEEKENLLEVINQMRLLLEERINSNDEILAKLISGYVEMASAIETTINRMMEPNTEEEKAEFRAEIKKRHLEQLQMMEKIGRDVEQSATNDPSASVLRMAKNHRLDDLREQYGDPDLQDEDTTGDQSDG